MKINDSIVYNALNIFMSNESDMLVAVLDGVDVDSGTAWEIGYAYARGLPVYGLRTDFRMLGIERVVNLNDWAVGCDVGG